MTQRDIRTTRLNQTQGQPPQLPHTVAMATRTATLVCEEKIVFLKTDTNRMGLGFF